MHNRNIESIKIGILERLANNITTNSELTNESRGILKDMIQVINESKTISNINGVFNNLINEGVSGESLAIKYIDENLEQLKMFSNSEINESINKFSKRFSNSCVISENKLHNSIQYLIENLHNNNIDSNKYNSYSIIVENLNKNSEKTQTINEEQKIDDNVINIAFSLHEKTINELNESDREIYNEIIDSENREVFFENYKKTVMKSINEITNIKYKDQLTKTKEKITEMKYDEKTFISNIESLSKLKNVNKKIMEG